MATIVLVPGFWLGAWAWEEVARRLRAAGHDVYPVTLTGLAERAAEAGPGVNVDTHVADLAGLVRTAALRDVVLVGHSGANMAVTGAADRRRQSGLRRDGRDRGAPSAHRALADVLPPG